MMTNYNIKNDCRGMYEEEIFNTILEERGINNIDKFLEPTEDALLPLEDLVNIDKAADRVIEAIKNEESVAILWDTDTDGTTSGAIMTRYLQHFISYPVVPFIDEGKMHGLKGQNLDKFKSFDLLIIVDSLDKNEKQYKKLFEMGVDIIILDHHAIKPNIPYDEYTIFVSSQRFYDNPQLSGAGVGLKFCKYLDECFETDYADGLIDLAACGIVADMMDMTVMENRYIVYKGLQKIYNPAIKKIIGGFQFNSTAISFSVAPIINAANRMGKNEIVVKAFLADENKTVLKYIKELKKCKEDQNEEVNRLMPDVISQCESQKNKKMLTAIIDTPYGVAGLIGNKLLEKYQRPVLVLKDVGKKYAGSMRAIGVDDFREICNNSKLAEADGHELAAGIQIKKDNFNKFLSYIETNLPELKSDTTINIDVQIDISDVTRKLVDYIKKIDFVSGENFKPVRFYINDIREYEIWQMSNYKHLVVKPNDYLQIIKWNFNGSFDEMDDHAMMNDELEICCTLDSGFLGRKFVLKAVCDEIEEVD